MSAQAIESLLFLCFHTLTLIEEFKIVPKIHIKEMFVLTSSFLKTCLLNIEPEAIKNFYYKHYAIDPNRVSHPFIDFLIRNHKSYENAQTCIPILYNQLKSFPKIYQMNTQIITDNQNLLAQNYELKEQLSQKVQEQSNLSPPDIIMEKTSQNPGKFLFYYIHHKNVERNRPGYRGNRYGENIPEIKNTPQFLSLNLPPHNLHLFMYSILSFLPRFWYHIVAQFFNLPCYHEALKFRKDLQEEEGFSIEDLKPELFSQTQLLQDYIEGMWKKPIDDLPDNRFVLAIDAASLKVNAGFDTNGMTFGLVNNVQLPPEKIQQYLDNMNDFYKDHPDHARDVFVILLCPLDPNLKPIVLSRKYSIKGNATDSEMDDLIHARLALTTIRLEFIGYASDGDTHYLTNATDFALWMVGGDNLILGNCPNIKDTSDLSEEMKLKIFCLKVTRQKIDLEYYQNYHTYPTYFHYGKRIINIKRLEQNLSYPLTQHIQLSGQDPWFQDVLHMLKNHRYYLICNNPIQIIYGSDYYISFEDFQNAFGIENKGLFNNAHSTKMDDRLAYQFFNWSLILKVLTNCPIIGMILLPSALLLQVFFNKNLTRKQRYHLLNFGAAIIFIQRIFYSEKFKKTNKDTIPPYHKTWMDKYLILAASLASLFSDQRSFDLSDCGSHLLEHLYGMIRRLCAGDDSQKKFDQALEKAICLRRWLDTINFNGYIPGRLPQDSAAKVEPLEQTSVATSDVLLDHFSDDLSDKSLDNQVLNDPLYDDIFKPLSEEIFIPLSENPLKELLEKTADEIEYHPIDVLSEQFPLNNEFLPFGCYVKWAITYFRNQFVIPQLNKFDTISIICEQFPSITFSLNIPIDIKQRVTSQRQHFDVNTSGNSNDKRFSSSNQDQQLINNIIPKIPQNHTPIEFFKHEIFAPSFDKAERFAKLSKQKKNKFLKKHIILLFEMKF